MMSSPLSHSPIPSGLLSARAELLAAARTVPPERRAEVFLGVWSVKDLLAHLIGWDYANRDSVEDIRAGKNPRVFQHYNPDWRAFNALLVQQYRRDDWDELLAALETSHRALIEFLQTLSPEDFDRDFNVRSPRGRVITIAHHLQAEIDDELEHRHQLTRWLTAHPT